MKEWDGEGRYAIKHHSGKWQICKYGSSPVYGLFRIWTNRPGKIIKCSDNLQALKAIVANEERKAA